MSQLKDEVRFQVLPRWIQKALRDGDTKVLSPGFEVTYAKVKCPDEYVLSIRRTQISCMDCGDSFEEYMVTDETWATAGLEKGRICLGCLQARLQRPLELADFPEGPVLNRHIHLGAELALAS